MDLDLDVIREREELLAWLDAGAGDASLLLDGDAVAWAGVEQRLVDLEVRRTLTELLLRRDGADVERVPRG